MRIHEIKDKKGRVFAFEVSSSSIGRGGICSVVKTIPNSKIIREYRKFSFFSKDEICKFKVNGQLFKVSEPWGDSSRFWIGPDPPKYCKQTIIVKKAFAKLGWVRAILRSFGWLG